MIRAQVRSVQNTHVVCRNATALTYMVGKEVEVHPGKEKGQSNDVEKTLDIIAAPSPKAQRGQITGSRTHRDQTIIRTQVY